MSTQFTPGPWEAVDVSEDAPCEFGVIAKNQVWHDKCKPSDICSVWWRSSNKRTRANARLIAAAPDLLAALIALNDDYKKALAAIAKHDGPVTSRLSDEADAAIARATQGH